MGTLLREVIVTRKNLHLISEASLKELAPTLGLLLQEEFVLFWGENSSCNRSIHIGKALASSEANSDLQKLFPFVKLAEKDGGIFLHLVNFCTFGPHCFLKHIVHKHSIIW